MMSLLWGWFGLRVSRMACSWWSWWYMLWMTIIGLGLTLTVTSYLLNLINRIFSHNFLVSNQKVSESFLFSIRRIIHTTILLKVWRSWMPSFSSVWFLCRLCWTLSDWSMFFRQRCSILAMALRIISRFLILKEKTRVSLRARALSSAWSILGLNLLRWD